MSDQDIVAQNEISDFRATHGEALFSASHPEHDTRVRELFDLTAKHFGNEPISDRGYIPSRATEAAAVKPLDNSSQGTPDQPLTVDAAKALQAEITTFRNQHSAALYESGHPEHERRVSELSVLTTRLHGDNPANDQITGTSAKTVAIVEDMMKPIAAADFKIGQLDDFGKGLPPYDEWNSELEADARSWMAHGEFNEGDARGVMAAVRDGMAQDFSQEYSDANYDKSVSYLRHQYGDEGLSEAIAASNRVVAEIGGDKLRQLLRETGLGTDPAIVFAVSRLAERKGYIKRKGAQQ